MFAMITISLPLPPSANGIWRVGRSGVHRSARYRSWQVDAGWELKAQRPGRVEGPVEVTINAGRPDNRRRDADNLCKGLLDLLQAHKVIENDSKVVRVTSGWDRSVPGGRVVIIVKGADADA